MRIVGINSHPGGSTKNIMIKILDEAEVELQAETYAFWGKWKTKSGKMAGRKPFGFYLENAANAFFSRETGIHCYGSEIGTSLLIRELERIKPDIIHLHNLHLWTINVPSLMRYIKRNHIRVVWTLHDCWAFTGHCAHFLQTGCEKWRTGCYDCESLNRYPYSKRDKTELMWKKKKEWFTEIEDLTIVTPSKWLESMVKKSFLNEYPIKVINNGVNLDIFKPTNSEFKKKNGIEGKFVVLGIAFQWSYAKGIDVFIQLAKDLDPQKFAIVLVGTSNEIDNQLPDCIISIHQTENIHIMTELYSAANVFVNPTREDNFPTTIMESLACGTPVITYSVGGCPEIIDDHSGIAVPVNEYETLKESIIILSTNPEYFSDGCCVERAKIFNEHEKYKEYVHLYSEILGRNT